MWEGCGNEIWSRGGGNAVQMVQRHHFASHLKRMAVVVRIYEQFLAFVKGAPETIQETLIDLPPSYVKTYKKYTSQGSRVLPLAYKFLPEMTVSEARSLDRDLVESGLTFAGFAVFNCPIRGDSATVLSELKGSSHDLVQKDRRIRRLQGRSDFCWYCSVGNQAKSPIVRDVSLIGPGISWCDTNYQPGCSDTVQQRPRKNSKEAHLIRFYASEFCHTASK